MPDCKSFGRSSDSRCEIVAPPVVAVELDFELRVAELDWQLVAFAVDTIAAEFARLENLRLDSEKP